VSLTIDHDGDPKINSWRIDLDIDTDDLSTPIHIWTMDRTNGEATYCFMTLKQAKQLEKNISRARRAVEIMQSSN
jgi:hypothetical protein